MIAETIKNIHRVVKTYGGIEHANGWYLRSESTITVTQKKGSKESPETEESSQITLRCNDDSYGRSVEVALNKKRLLSLLQVLKEWEQDNGGNDA